jgi:hypothetical protein
MPKLVSQCTAAPLPPDLWEEYPVFRETCLMYVTEPRFQEALRAAGNHFFAMLLEGCGEWPESSTRTELRAAAADLRHLRVSSPAWEGSGRCLPSPRAMPSSPASPPGSPAPWSGWRDRSRGGWGPHRERGENSLSGGNPDVGAGPMWPP